MDDGDGYQDSNRVGYVGSDASFGTRDSHETLTVVEEEQSITSHNFNNTINEMDYTTDFISVLNGSPNRNTLRQRRIDHLSPNQYSVLETENNDSNNISNINHNNNNNNNNSNNINDNTDIETNPTNTSAKTDKNSHNE